IRVAIFGIPNVGKSTIINKLSNKQRVIVGNKPGVTKANKWIRIDNNIELLDTPGLLWPRLNENDVGIKLALTGNIKQDILDVYDLSLKGIDYLINNLKYKDMLINKYKLGNIDELKNYEILELIGRKRGCIISGSEVDLNRTSCLFLDEIKNGKIGKFNLDENLD
ncbi:MAG: GTPase, partial [Clostridia bacterium]